MREERSSKRRQTQEIEDDSIIDQIMAENSYTFATKKPFSLKPKHQQFLEHIQDAKTNMVFVDGPAGTAKTYVAVYGALELLRREKVDEIIYIRSIIESASKSMGALPGDSDEKFSPYTMPLVDKLHEIVQRDTMRELFDKGLIRTVPVNFTRGLTFNKACVILDEAQNLTRKELVTILTRFGSKSTYIVCGDTFQADIRDTGFEEIMDKFDTDKSRAHHIHCMKFGKAEIVRSAILKFIVSVIGS